MRKMLVAGVVLAALVVVAAIALGFADRALRGQFDRMAGEVRRLAGDQDPAPVTEDDLRSLPEPVARWLRYTGAVGKPRMSAVRIVHGGRFRTGADEPWMPIRGEYLVTTRRPSFVWYGKATVVPGVSVVALDSYFDGRGRMLVRALSAFPIADASSPETARSAFGRCIAELTMAPTAFLDRTLARCEQTGPDSARCTVTDGGLSAEADLHVNPDGSLERLVVLRNYDRGGGRTTPERFTARSSGSRSFDGRLLPARYDGTWNLAEGDLHYVAFEVESVRAE